MTCYCWPDTYVWWARPSRKLELRFPKRKRKAEIGIQYIVQMTYNGQFTRSKKENRSILHTRVHNNFSSSLFFFFYCEANSAKCCRKKSIFTIYAQRKYLLELLSVYIFNESITICTPFRRYRRNERAMRKRRNEIGFLLSVLQPIKYTNRMENEIDTNSASTLNKTNHIEFSASYSLFCFG